MRKLRRDDPGDQEQYAELRGLRAPDRGQAIPIS